MEFLVKLALFIAAIVFFYKGSKYKTKPEKINQKDINPQCDWVQKMRDAETQKSRVCGLNPQFRDLEFLYSIHNQSDSSVIMTNRGFLFTQQKVLIPYQSINGYRFDKVIITNNHNNGITSTSNNQYWKKFRFDYYTDEGQLNTADFNVRTEEVNVFTDMFMTIMRQVQG